MPAAAYRFGDFELDLGRYELRRAGQLVHVEPQVFEVLAYLVRHHGQTVLKTELLDAVWGSRYVSDSTLTSRIKAARRALGDDGHRQSAIATVHGRGYRFVVPIDAAPGPGRDPPQEIRYCVAADGVHLAYAVTGEGPPLVKAANWLTHLDREWTSPVWRHWLEALAERHMLVRYDERGCGLSDREVPDFGFEARVADLECVLDAVGVERFPLLGLSQGGAVAIAYAVRHPERVTHLVLAGAFARGRFVRAETEEERAEALLDLEVARVGWCRGDSAFRQFFATQFLPDASPPLWDAFSELQRDTTSAGNVVRFLDEFGRIDVSDLAPRVRCPTLIFQSRGDLRVPEKQARELAALIPNSRLVLLDSRNHILMRDEPAWPVFTAELERFLASAA